jgi:hypothetical protein
MLCELAGLSEHSSSGDREVQCEMRGNVLIGEATYAVGPEESSHVEAFSLTAGRISGQYFAVRKPLPNDP